MKEQNMAEETKGAASEQYYPKMQLTVPHYGGH